MCEIGSHSGPEDEGVFMPDVPTEDPFEAGRRAGYADGYRAGVLRGYREWAGEIRQKILDHQATMTKEGF